jgi:RNA polymerase sigma-70 factor (ECF subfamily)
MEANTETLPCDNLVFEAANHARPGSDPASDVTHSGEAAIDGRARSGSTKRQGKAVSDEEYRPEDAAVRCSEELLAAIAGFRDRTAFVTLFGFYAPKLKAWFRRGGCTAQQAEDLAQETMLSVWRKAAMFDPCRASAATWIFAIARNQRIDALRRTPRADPEPDPGDATIDTLSPDVVYDAAEREKRVREALRQLPAEQADVIRLSFFEDRPHAEIERVLGIPLGTVKSRLRLAMTRLRSQLGEPGSDPGSGRGAAPAARRLGGGQR